jgi:AcrR family transcriptional regulator
VASRTRGTEERRAELLEAARRLFVRDGFAEVSVSRIVREIGVAQGTFYYYFDSKEAALDALVEAHVADVAAHLAAIAEDPALDHRGALQAMARAQLEHGAQRARELSGIPGADAHAKFLSGTVHALAPVYRATIARGQRAGVFRPGQAELLGETLALMAHTLFDQELLGWTDQQYAYRRRMLAELFAFLLGVEGGLDFGTRPAPEARLRRRKRSRSR